MPTTLVTFLLNGVLTDLVCLDNGALITQPSSAPAAVPALTALRSDIEADMAAALNRSDLSAQIPTWFNYAHRDIQRRHNFVAMQKTDVTSIPFVVNTDKYPVFTDMKEPIQGFSWDPVQLLAHSSWHLTNMASVRHARRAAVLFPASIGDPSAVFTLPAANVFAVWQGNFELYPKPGTEVAGFTLGMDYYAFLGPPIESGMDWFTDNARDYLTYRGLLYAEPYIKNDPRLVVWKILAEDAFTRVYNHDVAAQAAGELVMRG